MRILFLCMAAALAAIAQSYTGSIGGRVTDASGLPVAGVKIVLVESATANRIETRTGESGDYRFPFLRPGRYELAYSAQGFKEREEKDVILQLTQPLTLDVQLQVGDLSEKVTVSAAASQINLVSPEVGHVVDADQLVNVPLVASNSRGRSPLLLSKLVAGVTSTSSTNSNINNFSFGGGRPVTNEILVDGLPTTNPSDQTYTFTPSPDSVQEFKVLTVPFSAEYGHTGGGVMMLTSRGGSNEFHGSAYDYFRNRLLNGRNFFAPTRSLAKSVQNDPGGTFGGPLILPRIYNGRNKTFFFGDFNVTLAYDGQSLFSGLVPTAAEKQGDFSQSRLASGRPVVIYDPATTRIEGGKPVRDPFVGNRIPSARFDSTGAQVIQAFPDSNGTFANGSNYLVAPTQERQTWQWLGRIDQYIGAHDRMFGRLGGYNPNSSARNLIPGKANPSTAGGFSDLQLVLSETHDFSTRAINEFRFGIPQERNYTFASSQPVPELGLKGVASDSFPIVSAAQFLTLGSSSSNRDRDRSFVLHDALSLQLGRHSLKTGGDFRNQNYHNYDPGKLSGRYSFGQTYSALPGDSNTGYSLADLLLGYPTATSISLQDYTYRLMVNSAGLYVQDDFKVNSKLTLNLGVRWEWNGPQSERNNQFASFDPTIPNRTTGNLGEVQFAGRDGAPEHFTPNVFYTFLPRIGLAYQFLPKTVVRAGYGIYRLPSIGFADWWPVSQYVQVGTLASSDPLKPLYQWSQGVPQVPFNVDAQGRPYIPASITSPSSDVRMLETRQRTPYNQNWQLSIQRQFGNWFADATYAANKGTKLPAIFNLNQLRPSQFSLSAPTSARPYPQYRSVNALLDDANSIYHSLQLTLNHRFKNGFLVTSAYTWSKLINDLDAPARANAAPVQDYYNLKAERGIGGYDVPHRFVVSFWYQLPFGSGGKYGSTLPVIKHVIGGWELAGITEYQAGLPLGVAQPNNLGGYTNVQRVTRTRDGMLPRDQRTVDRWFDTGAFSVTPALQFGNSGRFPLRSPGLANWDATVMRTIPIVERVRLQFRGEFYNLMNHANFNSPNTSITDRNFGRITSSRDPRIIQLGMRIFF